MSMTEAPLVSEAEIAAWYEGKTFSADWTSWHFPNWMKWFAPYRTRSTRVLEIGSWEGRSALFFLNFLPHAALVCIDTFAGGEEHQGAVDLLPQIEKRFDANTAAFTGRVEKIKAQSINALAALGLAQRRFDIAYIDGSHRAADVYVDAVLTWPLMVPGGLILFDDYQWAEAPDPLGNPKAGIDSFLAAHEAQYRVIHHEYQVAVLKL
jgi:predicted O-methyltransferase YrrM